MLLLFIEIIPFELLTFCIMPDCAKKVDNEEAKLANWFELMFQLFRSPHRILSTNDLNCDVSMSFKFQFISPLLANLTL